MILRTGRTRTLTLTGAFDGSLYYTLPPPPPAQGTLRRPTVSASFPAANASVWAQGVPGPRSGIIVKATVGMATNQTDDIVQVVAPYTRSIAGTYTISVPVEEVVELTIASWDADVGYPIWTMDLYERTQVGGTVTASITAGGLSISASGSITDATRIGAYGPELEATMDTSQSGSTTSISGSVDGLVLWHPGYTYSESGCTGTISAGSVSATTSSTGVVTAAGTMAGQCGWSVNGITKAYDADYPGNLDLLVDRDSANTQTPVTVGASWTEGGSQHEYAAAAVTINNVTHNMPTADSTFHPIRVRMRASGSTYSLATLGEDTADVYVPFRCWPTFSGVAVKNYWLSFDNCSSLTPGGNLAGQWTGIGGATLSIENNQIRIDTTAAGAQGVRRTFTNRWANLSQGIFEISMTGPSGPGIAVTVYSPTGAVKTWTRDRAGRPIDLANGTIYLDTCNPDSATTAVDTWDTRWPLPTVDSDYSGVTCCNQIEITGLQNSQTYRLVNLEVTWWSKTSVTCMASRAGWVLEQSAQISETVNSDTFVVRGVLGMSDGRQSFETARAVKTVVHSSAGDSTTLSEVPIKTLLSQDNNPTLEPWPAYPGWTMTGTIVTDPADGGLLRDWLNTNRSIGWLRGGGWAYVPGTGWVPGTDLNADYHNSGYADLYGQVCVDSISFYPGCGDAFSFSSTNTGAYGPTLYCAAAAVLRGGGHGLVYGGDPRLPVNNQTVTCTDTVTNGTAGTGTTNSLGWWQSGSPYGRGERQIKTAAGAQFAYTTWHNRKRQRVVLSTAAAAVYRCVEYDYPRNWLHASDAKKIKTAHAYDFLALMKSTDFAYTWRRLRANPRGGSLLMLGITPASQPPYTYHVCYSRDGGLSNQELFSMTANSALIEHDLARGLWVLLYESGGAIQRRTCSDASDMSSWSSPTALAISGTLLDSAYDRRYARMVVVTTSSGTTRLYSSSDSGETWTERLV